MSHQNVYAGSATSAQKAPSARLRPVASGASAALGRRTGREPAALRRPALEGAPAGWMSRASRVGGVDRVGQVVRTQALRVGSLHLQAQLRPRIAPRTRPPGMRLQARQMRMQRPATGRRQTPIGPPNARERPHEVAPTAPSLELAARMTRAQPDHDAIPQRHGLRPAACPLHADRAHRQLRRQTTRLIQSGQSARHDPASLPIPMSEVGHDPSQIGAREHQLASHTTDH